MKTVILILWITTMDGTSSVDRAMESHKACQTAGRAIEGQIRHMGLGRVVWACITKGEETKL